MDVRPVAANAKDKVMKCTDNLKALAERGHAGQLRKDGKIPYIEHPRAVVALLGKWGVTDGVTLAIAWGHDLLEDTAIGEAEIRRAGGPANGAAILAGIKALTRDPEKWPDKKEWLREVARTAPPDILLVKAADRICNTRDFLALGDPAKARDYLAQAAPVFALTPKAETVANELELVRKEIDEAGNPVHPGRQYGKPDDSASIKRIMWGREEFPLTVFVPWDCGLHCPFCTTKAEYGKLYPASRFEKNFERVKESLKRLLEYGFFNEIVFTGGEPLADVDHLEELVSLVRGQRVYINTTLNLDERKAEEAIRFLQRAHDAAHGNEKVGGISVSLPYADVRMTNSRGFANLKRLMEAMQCLSFNWCRINSVVRGTETPEQIRAFVEDLRQIRGKGPCNIWSVNLRKDYTTCDQSNLNDCFDPTLQTLMSMPELTYLGHGGCLVCRNDVFAIESKSRMATDPSEIPRLTYHRGVENTSVRYGDFMIVNDIIVKPDGEIRYDWCPGTQLPKRVMDVLARTKTSSEPPHGDEFEWKWKNPLFSRNLTIGGHAGAMSCRDRPWERCG